MNSNLYVCQGVRTTAFEVSSPDCYSVSLQWSAAAIAAGLGNAGSTTLTGSTTIPITTVPLTPGTYTGTLYANDYQGCSSPYPVSITVGGSPVATAVGPTTFCNGGSVDLKTMGGQYVGYQWKKDGIAISLARSSTYNAKTSGTYTCDLSIPSSCTITTNPIVVTVIPPITVDAKFVCSGASVALTGTPIGGIWNGTGVSGSIFNSSGLLVGDYTVTYMVTNSNGCPSTNSAVVSVKPLPITNAGADKSICSGESSTISLSSTPPASSFSWTYSATNVTGASTGSGASISQILVNSGISVGNVIYRITPIANGCAGTPTDVTITVTPKPTITNTTAQLQTTICTGSSLNFTPTTNLAGTAFTWTSNVSGSITGVASSGSGAITNTLTNSGSSSGSVTYTIIPTTSGCSGTAANYIVTVNPKINATLIGSPSFCTSTKLSAYPAGNSYLWSNGMTTQSITVSSSGTYSVTVSNATLCSGTASISVVRKPASAYIYQEGTDLCSGITLTSSYGTSYLWSTGAQASSILVYSPGTYRVTVTNSNGCTATASYIVSSNPLVSRVSGGTVLPSAVPPCPTAQTSLSEQSQSEISVYPNPANEEVVVQLTTSLKSDAQLSLFNQQGKKMESVTFQEGERTKTIPTKNLSDGLYFIKIGNSLTKKIIVKHP